ncbi:MAG TPA: WG repeat-containing protein [Bacteroidia bacterium]|nr:WG repeat-containing protein [Bacteroidia bacterium]
MSTLSFRTGILICMLAGIGRSSLRSQSPHQQDYYEEIGLHQQGYSTVAINHLYGVINFRGQLVIPCIYQAFNLGDFAPCFSNGLIAAQKEGKWGVLDTLGKVVVPFLYEQISSYRKGLAIVRNNSKEAFIDLHGKFITPFAYEEMGRMRGEVVRVKADKKIGYLDSTGKQIIPCCYEDGYALQEDLIAVKQHGKYGFVNIHDSTVISFQYESAYGFFEGLAAVTYQGKTGFINSKNELVIPFQFDSLQYFYFTHGFAAVALHHKWGWINRKGEFVIPPVFDRNYYSDERLTGCLIVEKKAEPHYDNKSDLFALYDTTGKALTELIYSSIYYQGRGRFLACRNGGYEILDTKGKTLYSLGSYKELYNMENKNYVVITDSALGYIDSLGSTMIPPVYRMDNPFISLCYDSIAAVMYHDVPRLITMHNKCIVGCEGNREVNLKYPNGVVQIKGTLKDFYREGLWVWRYKNGNKRETGTFIKGHRQGAFTEWFENGKIKSKAFYSNDTLDKLHQEFDEHSGKVVLEEVYDRGKFVRSPINSQEVFSGAYTSGEKKEQESGIFIRHFKDGKLELKGKGTFYERRGIWTECVKDVVEGDSCYVCGTGLYENSKREGVWKYYSGSKKLLFTETYKSGMQVEPEGVNLRYNLRGKIYEKGLIHNGHRDSIWENYYPNGSIHLRTEYVQGELSGKETEYGKNGKILNETHYAVMGKLNDTNFIELKRGEREDTSIRKGSLQSYRKGDYTEYFPDGKPKLMGRYDLLLQKANNPSDWHPFMHLKDTVIGRLDETVLDEIRTGVWTSFFPNGEVESEGLYCPVYAAAWYQDTVYVPDYEDSHIMVLKVVGGSMRVYLKQGSWRYYSEQGELILEERYEEGRLKKKIVYSR